jgi:hypothetical protein
MEEKINIAEILKDKKDGIRLYSPIFGECTFCYVREDTNDICVKKHNGVIEYFNSEGLYFALGEVMLFPSKEMRDWEKFSWKKGDVLSNGEGDYCVFKEFAHSSYQTSKAVFVKRNKESIHSDSCLLDTKDWHKASHSCTDTYINTIEKELSGKLNMETLEIEKAHTEFHDGDVLFVKCKGSAFIEIFNYFKNNGDLYDHASLDTTTHELDISGEYKIFKENIIEIRLATKEEKKQFFSALAKKGKAWDSDKKAIVGLKPKVELKPFDKVLVRDFSKDKWSISFFSFKKEDFYVCINNCSWNQCIPYIGNESLLGTTKDVEG